MNFVAGFYGIAIFGLMLAIIGGTLASHRSNYRIFLLGMWIALIGVLGIGLMLLLKI